MAIPIFTQKDLIEIFPKFYPMFDKSNNVTLLNNGSISEVLYTNKLNIKNQYDISMEVAYEIIVYIEEIGSRKNKYTFYFNKAILNDPNFIKYIKLYKRINNITVEQLHCPDISYGENVFSYYDDDNKNFEYVAYGTGFDSNIIIPYMTNANFKYLIENVFFDNDDKKLKQKHMQKLIFDHDVFNITLPVVRRSIDEGSIGKFIFTGSSDYHAHITYVKNFEDLFEHCMIIISLTDKYDKNYYEIKLNDNFIDSVINNLDLSISKEEEEELEELKNNLIQFYSNINLQDKNLNITPKSNNSVIKCPKCGSDEYYRRGKVKIKDVEHQRFSCKVECTLLSSMI